jgi:cation:H+ antiporter
MMGSSFGLQIILFLISGLAIWYFCNKLSDVVEYIDAEFGLGDAFGGTLILSIVTNLPEIAIAVSGSLRGNVDLVTGNLLGGIAVQTMLLILYDFANKDPRPLSTIISSKAGIFQGTALIIILGLCLYGGETKNVSTFLGAGMAIWMVIVIWLASLYFLKKFQTKSEPSSSSNNHSYSRSSSLWWLAGISIVVLFFGVILENTSDAIADHFQLSGMFFGATILALVTSLPEISSGLEFVKNKDFQPIISDIFGGNGFLPVLFLPASIITGKNIIESAGKGNNLLTLLSILMTLVFVLGMKLKSPKKVGILGWDNWLMLVIGIIGFSVLYHISQP